MNPKVVLIYLGLLIVAYLAGTRNGPERVKTETVTVIKEVKVQDERQQTAQVTRVIETVRKDGRPLKKTITETVSASERKTTELRAAEQRESKEVETRRGVTISALVGLPLGSIATGPVYGVSVQKSFIGPISLGAWAFVDLRIGLSVGLEL